MALSNHERVGKALDLLRNGLAPYVEREFISRYEDQALIEARRLAGDDHTLAKKKLAQWDATALLRLIWDAWNDVFKQTLGFSPKFARSKPACAQCWPAIHAFLGCKMYPCK